VSVLEFPARVCGKAPTAGPRSAPHPIYPMLLRIGIIAALSILLWGAIFAGAAWLLGR
jgi:hypothetical protein